MNEDYRDFIAALLDVHARFLIVGAHALAAHGVPRATVDLDVWVEATPDNVRRVWHALAAFGAPLESLNISEADLLQPDMVAQFGMPPNRIDVLTGVSGLEFPAAWADRMESNFGGLRAPFLGRKSFIQNKRASGRLKDLADIEALGG
ncbi:MAG: hypothetical protein WD825_11495 [Gemmatimonadaceae bacterium]